MTLYADLGVTPDADIPTIKAAHRRAVKRHHPDTGGDRTKFELAQRAWTILSDPTRRDRYDRLGDDGNKPDNEISELIGVIMPAFDQILAQAGNDIAHIDVMAATQANLQASIGKLKQHIKANRQQKRGLEQVMSRVSFNGKGPNLIGNVLRERIASLDTNVAQAEAKIGLFERACLHLDLYGWEFAKPAALVDLGDDALSRLQY